MYHHAAVAAAATAPSAGECRINHQQALMHGLAQERCAMWI
jgi:hypothetical protein